MVLRIDDLDRKIIASLVENGRLGFATLGRQLGLSTPAVKRRVDRLVAGGVVRRFTAEIDQGSLGWTLEAFVELYCDGQIPPDQMRDLVASIPEVSDSFTVTGEADAILIVHAEDAAHLEQILGRIRKHPKVTRTRSSIVLSHL